MSNACLQVSNVNFSYPKREALRALSLELAVGEVSVLLGPNGAGKSTLFGLLTGLHALQSGEIRFQGVSVVKNRAALLDKLGVVFQQSTLDLDLSVEQNLRYHAALRGMGRKQAQQRINVELERFGLLDRTKETVRSLNGGIDDVSKLRARYCTSQPYCFWMNRQLVWIPTRDNVLAKL